MFLTKTDLVTPADTRPILRAEDRRTSDRHSQSRLVSRGRRIVLTYRPRDRDREHLTTAPIAFQALRLFALDVGHDTRRRGRNRRTSDLAVYRPTIDLPGSGRIRFTCVRRDDSNDFPTRVGPEDHTLAVLNQALDDDEDRQGCPAVSFPRFYFAFPRRRPPVYEPTFPHAVWEAAAIEIHGLRAWPAEMLARPEGRRFPLHPVHRRPCPWSQTAAVAEGTVLDGWILRHGVPTPMAQLPEVVFARTDHLRGRRRPNPAVAVLHRHGLLPAGPEFLLWLRALGPVVHGLRRVLDPRDETTPAGRFRAALEHYATADPAREEALRADLRAACAAIGVPLPGGPARHDAETELLLSPWTPVVDPDAIAIQRLSPAARAFSTGSVAIDFNDPSTPTRPGTIPTTRRRADRRPSPHREADTANRSLLS